MTPEFSRPLVLDRLGERDSVEVVANEPERRAVAARLGLPAVPALRCRFALRRGADGCVHAAGRLEARVEQVCVVSLEPFEHAVQEAFRACFVPAGSERDDIDPAAEDELPYADGVLDLGEAAVEQLALALDPFPRRPGVVLNEPGEVARDNPFAALARLRPAEEPGEET